MTKKEIDAMEAGRELDALIAERVMGWQITKRKPHLMHIAPWIGGGDIMAEDYTPAFSGHIADAWLVVEKLRTREGWRHFAEALERQSPWHWAALPVEIFCLNVCRAALKVTLNCHKITTNEADEPTEKTG